MSRPNLNRAVGIRLSRLTGARLDFSHLLQGPFATQLLAQVVRRTGLRSADIKPVVEATLAELGNAIAAGMTLALPPLGRARVRHSIDRSGAEIVTLRLRRRPDAEPLGDG